MEKQHTIIVGNWKMYGHKELANALLPPVMDAARDAGATVVVCPPSLLIPHVARLVQDASVKIGGQDCHVEKEGAFTGNTSAAMLKEAGCQYVIIGHSERRQYHHETDADVHGKAAQAMASGLIPIICVGETLAEREAGQAQAVVKKQLMASIPSGNGQFLLAYEPVWAIGSGKTPTALDIKQMHGHIRQVVSNHKGMQTAVLYGGSVKAANAAEILATDAVSGVLVGGASLKAEEFCGIIAATAALKKG
ncbi:MAG: triose-phosphate isomerase [Alphaproteobacteria bacterium]